VAADPKRSRTILDPQLGLMVLVLGLLAALAWWQGGAPLLRKGLSDGGALLLRFSAIIAISFLAAGLAQALVPRPWVQAALGHGSGVRGILLATGAGMVTPAGPYVSMPIAAILLRSGASPSAVVSFLTAWSLLALHRFVAWEVPIVGLRFALLRYGVSLLLPVLAGLGTRVLLRGN
jgi:uncharacterized membrane protein YraQ (UPF0718 family)